ncbi:hypothetical protein N0V83_007107 [Neocucurbitaria cava]|uniref:Uncharacterized protein n=1 Tax=Neocucurbitaria cava TaxID=798079 RepID=A0A9W8Y7H4_9PLEO|nr:hypothetical protein N0V83_007107 [Neocucurbitaria cava]
MAAQTRAQDRHSLLVEIPSEANSRLFDLKAALATSPTVIERPQSHGVPTKFRVPKIISRIKLFKKSKDLSGPSNPTRADGWTCPELQEYKGRASNTFSSKKRQSTVGLQERAEITDRPNRSSSWSRSSEEDASAGESEESDDSESALQLVEHEQSGLTNILHQSYRILGTTGSNLSCEQGHQVSSYEEANGSGNIEFNHIEHGTEAFSGTEGRNVEEEDSVGALTASRMIESEERLDYRRDMHPRAYSPLFAAPTEASIAKQDEKVALANLRATCSTKPLSNRPSSAERRYKVHRDIEYTSRGRSRRSDDSDTERNSAPLFTRTRPHDSNTRGSPSFYSEVHNKLQVESYITGDYIHKTILGNDDWMKEREDLIKQVELLKEQVIELEKNKNICLIDLEASNKEKGAYFNKLTEQLQEYEKRLDWFRQKLLRYKMRAETRIAALEEQIIYEDPSEVAVEGARCFRLNSLYQSFDAVGSELAKFGKEKEAMEAQIHETERDRDEIARQLEALQQELRIAQVGEQNLKQENNNLIARFQQHRSNAADDNSGQESPTCDAIQSENDGLRLTNAETRRELDGAFDILRTANLRAEQAEEDREASDAVLGRLRKDIEKVYNVITHGGETMSGNKDIAWSMLEALTQCAKAFDVDHESPRSMFFQLMRRVCEHTKSLYSKNYELQDLLTDKEYDLTLTRATLQRQRKDTLMDTSKEKPAWQADRDTFEKLFRDEREKRRAAEGSLETFRATAEKQYHAEIERKDREFQISLRKAEDGNAMLLEQVRKAEDGNAMLHEQVKKYEAGAHQWEHEYNLAITEREMRTAAFEEHIQELKNEVLLYIKEYHDKTHDPDHWRIEGLQNKVRTLERELKTTNDLFGQTKRERARLEDEVARLMDANKQREKDIARLGRAWITGSAAPTLVETVSSDTDEVDSMSRSASSSSLLWLTTPKRVNDVPRVPRCHLPLEIEKREQAMVQFRKDQQRRREEQEAPYKTLENARRLRMGPFYPPAKEGWQDLVKKDVWERWDE